MNENLNLEKILKYCPKGTKLYSTVFGEVKLEEVKENSKYPIMVNPKIGGSESFTSSGRWMDNYDGECTLFPSKEQRDWSKFKPKQPKFDPNTLQVFDKVLARLTKYGVWHATFFSHYDKEVKGGCYPFVTTSGKSYPMCIPYNDDTKHLVGTGKDAPEYYRYWED